MITAREVVLSLFGAYRLARFDAGGADYFDKSLDGFWRSFFAAAIVAPMYLLLIYTRFATGMVDAHAGRYLSVEATAYVMAWVAFPLAILPVARMLDREGRYLGFIVAYNWASVLQNAVYLPLVILGLLGALPPELASGLNLIVLSLIMLYTWFVTRTMLDVDTFPAAGVVIVDLVLSVFIGAIAEGMLRGAGSDFR